MAEIITLTPEERAAAEDAIENMVGSSKAALVVESVIDEINEYRLRDEPIIQIPKTPGIR